MTDVAELPTTNTATPFASPAPSGSARRAATALLLACLVWGGSFTWAKAATSAINARVGLPASSSLGPVLLLGWRFGLAGVLWFILFPRARRGWTWRSVSHALLLGTLFMLGVLAQQTGWARTAE